ncbi:PEP-CTERM protein-sorting domain [Nostoc flagelliforme CCNUN1]|uniref:PEP-CTERM protein-sorting domain n=1 Tax=Nostoc flagelliforme CCNUN1 TaxID=2038116 RepID=A0A2K8SHN1_9NOSO|nr:PEP-CTERM sorting domain-containing protein [Nostoc flagelliforme]AUB34365.1 PEP-CTERM protein-sorting domain [Nostoc flagelliforme CCNUN1]
MALLSESESAVVNLDAKEVLFTIDFNRVPDFFTLDQVGRQADSFQYFIDPSGELPIFRPPSAYSNLSSIIRGEEINVAGDIRIRDVFSVGPLEPNSGGWGKIRGSVPYSLDGTVLKFSAPLQFIGDSDGLFSYRLELYEFGGGGGNANENKSIIASVPEPTSALGALTFGALSLGLRRKRKHKLAPSPVNRYDSVKA